MSDTIMTPDPVVGDIVTKMPVHYRAASRELLLVLGIPGYFRGHKYLTEAVAICAFVNKPGYTKRVIYSELERIFGDSRSHIERDIRHAVSSSWERGYPVLLKKYFGYIVPADKKPANLDFIHNAARAVLDMISVGPDAQS